MRSSLTLIVLLSLSAAVAGAERRGLDRGGHPLALKAADPSGLEGVGQDSWLQQVTAQVRAEEYDLSQIQHGNGWTGPNRAQGLRGRWHRGRLEVEPRSEDRSWLLRYELQAVGRRSDAAFEPVGDVAMERVEDGRLIWHRAGDLLERYRNDERGIGQEMELLLRPGGEGDEPAVIEQAIDGLVASAEENGSSVLLRTQAGKDALRLGKLEVADAWGEQLPVRFEVGSRVVRILIDDRSATYPLVIRLLMTSPAWMAESDQSMAFFGFSADTAGDVNGDGYSDVIVGAYGYDNGQTDLGRAFVFHGSADGLETSPSWTAEGEQEQGNFGFSLGTAGDVNGDGYSDVIVGTPYAGNDQAVEGLTFVYHGSAAGLEATPSWMAEGNQDSGWFGYAVATAGDINGDGYSDVVIGALNQENGEIREGRALVYRGSAAGLETAPSWTAEGNQSLANYGCSVGSAGDVNGDGYSDIIVGAPFFANGQQSEGRAYVYHGSASGLEPVPAWTAEGNQNGACAGFAVGTAGDVNGDGYADVVVGAPYASNGQWEEGLAFVYYGSAAGLDPAPAWTSEGDQVDANYGQSVGTAGDVNGDGYSDVIVGTPRLGSGIAMVFHGSTSGLEAAPAWTQEGNMGSSNFGWPVRTAGDVNGDGYSDVVIGAHGYDNGENNEGAAFVFHGSGGSTPAQNDLLREWCTALGGACDLSAIFDPDLEPYLPDIGDSPGNVNDPEAGILSDPLRPLVFYQVSSPSTPGNVMCVKSVPTDTVTIHH